MSRMSYRGLSDGLGEIERRLGALENQITRLRRSAPRSWSSSLSSLLPSSDRSTDALVAALSDVTERFRHWRDTTGSEAMRSGNEVVRRYGNEAVKRLSAEVTHRPLMLLAVAAGIGLLVGMAAHRR